MVIISTHTRVGPVEEDHEQAGGFECLKSDSEGDDEQGGGISTPPDCVAQIAVAKVEEREAHGTPRRVELWSYRRRAQYPPKVSDPEIKTRLGIF